MRLLFRNGSDNYLNGSFHSAIRYFSAAKRKNLFLSTSPVASNDGTKREKNMNYGYKISI